MAIQASKGAHGKSGAFDLRTSLNRRVNVTFLHEGGARQVEIRMEGLLAGVSSDAITIGKHNLVTIPKKGIVKIVNVKDSSVCYSNTLRTAQAPNNKAWK